MKSLVQLSLSAMIALSTTNVVAAYQCQNEAAAEAVGGYEVIHQHMDEEIQRHMQIIAEEDPVQPVQATVEVAANGMIIGTHSAQAAGDVAIGASTYVFNELSELGLCNLNSLSEANLAGGIKCYFETGGNIVLLTEATGKAGTRVAEIAIVRATEAITQAGINASEDLAEATSGVKPLKYGFLAVSKVIQGGEYVITGVVGYGGDVISDGFNVLGDTACQPFRAVTLLLEGKPKQFLTTLFAGTIIAFMSSAEELLDNNVGKPLTKFEKFMKKHVGQPLARLAEKMPEQKEPWRQPGPPNGGK